MLSSLYDNAYRDNMLLYNLDWFPFGDYQASASWVLGLKAGGVLVDGFFQGSTSSMSNTE